MTLAERARQRQRRKGPTCTLGVLLATVDPVYAAELRDLLADPAIMGSTIAALLSEDGHEVKDQTVQRHRRGGCECPR